MATSYPAAFDDLNEASRPSLTHADVADAIVALQHALGINPAGAATDVAEVLGGKQDVGDYATSDDLNTLAESIRPSLPTDPIVIIENPIGTWSGTVPARSIGQNPVEIRSVTDPRDATNGVPGRANITKYDAWIGLPS